MGCTTPGFLAFPGPGSRAESRSKKIHFFCCTGGQIFCRITGKQAWPGNRPDITPGTAVQNILKKVKKRLVSPLKPR